MSLLDLDLSELAADPARRAGSLSALRDACSERGSFVVRDPRMGADAIAEAIDLANWFFALPPHRKAAVHIDGSPHFRGHSEMHNERDWREQLHLGRESAARDSPHGFHRLVGPNLWPDDRVWRARVLALMRAGEAVGRQLMHAIADAFAVPGEQFVDDDPAYLVMKFIRYHAQSDAGAPRNGVAAHCDFTWLTLLLQDDVGGLECQDRSGRWHRAEPVAGGITVNLGEVSQYASRGLLFASPHRVVNASRQRSRTSIPIFLSPSLDRAVRRWTGQGAALPIEHPPGSAGHVHRVLACDASLSDDELSSFGAAEWRRKGENIWCRQCCAPRRRVGLGE